MTDRGPAVPPTRDLPGPAGPATTIEAVLAQIVREAVAEAVDPLRLEIERLRADRTTLAPFPEAARRLGVTLRAVQKWAKDGRLEVVLVGGVRMVRLP